MKETLEDRAYKAEHALRDPSPYLEHVANTNWLNTLDRRLQTALGQDGA